MASRKEEFFESDYSVGKSTKEADIEASWKSVLKAVDETCHDILNANYDSRLFGCTTQGDWFVLPITGLPILFGMWNGMNCLIKQLFPFAKCWKKTTREERQMVKFD